MRPMPDELSAATLKQLEVRLSELAERLAEILKWINGNGGIGLAEQMRDNAREIEHLRAKVVALENDDDFRIRPVEIEKTKRAYLQTAKEWGALASALVALILGAVNLFILLGGS